MIGELKETLEADEKVKKTMQNKIYELKSKIDNLKDNVMKEGDNNFNENHLKGQSFMRGASLAIMDVEEDADFAVFRQDAKGAGFRAVQSTPMVTGNGNLLGIVSTHFANVHAPTPIVRPLGSEQRE